MIFLLFYMIESFLQLLRTITGDNPILYHAFLGLLEGILVIISGKLLKSIFGTIGKKIITKTETVIDDEVLAIVNSRIIALSSVIGIYLGMKELRLGLSKQNTNFFAFLDYADTVLYLVTVFIVASVIAQIFRTVTVHMIRSIAEKQKNYEFNHTLAPLVNRIVTIIIVSFAAIIVFEHFGQSVTSLLTILGAGSLALGLAAQDTISNMISGFIIMIDRPFRLGNRIKIPTGEIGDVFEIGLRSTKILDFDNNVLIVPNNELIKTKIVNYGYPDNQTRVVVEVLVAYGTSIDLVKKILLTIAGSHTEVLKIPSPEAYLMKLGDYGLHFSLFCRVSDFKYQLSTAEGIRIEIIKEFARAHIVIPYPHHIVFNTIESNDVLHTSSKRKKISR